jgi:hypothetical protein
VIFQKAETIKSLMSSFRNATFYDEYVPGTLINERGWWQWGVEVLGGQRLMIKVPYIDDNAHE